MKKVLLNNLKNKEHFIIISFCLFYITFFIPVNAQTLSVSGRVTASRAPVRDASVTFIDKNDTTKKFSVLTDATGNYKVSILTSVESNVNNFPLSFELAQNYPNPFTSSTAISYNLNKQSDIQVVIYDMLGREIRKFMAGAQTTGWHNITWDGKNSFGQRLASGVYFYRLQAGNESLVKKMILNSGGRNELLLSQHTFSSGLSNESKSAIKNFQASNYMVRVENTDATLPIIVPQSIDNVSFQKDTSINFSVTYIPTTKIDFDSLHQYIRGFGAANIRPWRPDMTDSEIETAFGTGEGQLGFSILRLMIQPDNSQWSWNISTAKKAQDMGAIIFASPWDPPSNLLENVNGMDRVRYDKYDQYAAHIDSFNTYMNSNGVSLYAVSVQNEPDYGDWTRWSAGEMLTFMKNNAGKIRNRVIAPESFQFRREMSDPILKDSAACANVDIIGGHIYGSGLNSYPLAEQKGKEIWMTEHYTESSHSANTWPLAFDVAKEIQGVMKANWNAYVWWYIVRFYGPIGDGESGASFPNESYARKGEVTKRGYLMSQFSRFIRPGFYRVESSVAPSISKVSVTAYKDPSSSKIIIVALNSDTKEAETILKIQNGPMTAAFTPYTTSETKNCEKGNEFNVTGSKFTYKLEPLSITTFVSN